jgi:DNA-binding protein
MTEMSRDENVYVGSKPVLSYVTALVTALERADKVNILARGRAISSAVDVVEITRRSFLTDLSVENISISTELLGEEDNKRNVSTITITVKRTKE